MNIKKVFVDSKFHRTDTFEIVDEWPSNYYIWNIGRHNFPHEEYIPLAKDGELEYHVDLKSLKAFKCPSEEIALHCLRQASRMSHIDYNKYLEIIKEYESVHD